jgi:hypothetical protein
MEGVHLHRPQSRWNDQQRAGDLRAGADLVRVPAQRRAGRPELVEVVDPTAAPTYTVASTCLRFPSSGLATALLSEVQQIIPLVHIRVRESAVADIYLSDRHQHKRQSVSIGRRRPFEIYSTVPWAAN